MTQVGGGYTRSVRTPAAKIECAIEDEARFGTIGASASTHLLLSGFAAPRQTKTAQVVEAVVCRSVVES